MTLDHALILSLDGIQLLERVSGEWALVASTKLGSDDDTAAMARLREAANTRRTGQLHVKLVLPNEQIRYLHLPATEGSDDDVRAALEGATPYALNDLVYDFDTDAGGTHIAAIAGETLTEVENFLRAHGFAPVSFTAAAPRDSFAREVWFGAASDAPPGLAEGPEDAPVRATSVLSPDAITPTPSDQSGPEIAAGTGSDSAKASDAAALALRLSAGGAERAAEPQPPAQPEGKTAPADAPVRFASRARVAAPVDTPEAPAPVAQDAGGAPVFRHRARTEPTLAPKAEPPSASQTARPAPKERPAPRETAPAPSARPAKAKAKAQPAQPEPRALRPAPAQPEPSVVPPPAAQGADQGSRRGARVGMAAIALLGLGGIAYAVSSLDLGQVFAPAQEEQATTTPPAAPVGGAAIETATVPAVVPEPPAPEPSSPPEPEPQSASQTTRILTPDEAQRIYAATGVWQRAPRMPERPRETGTTPGSPAQSVAVERLAPIGGLVPLTTVTGDQPPPAPIAPPPPEARFAVDADGFVIATPEGAVTPSGAIVYAGVPEIMPKVRPGTPEPPPAPTEAAAETLRLPSGALVYLAPPPMRPPPRPEPPAPETPEAVAPPEAGLDAGPDAAAEAAPAATEAATEASADASADAPAPAPATDVALDTGTDTDALNLVLGPPPLSPPTRPGTEPVAAPAEDTPPTAGNAVAEPTGEAAAPPEEAPEDTPETAPFLQQDGAALSPLETPPVLVTLGPPPMSPPSRLATASVPDLNRPGDAVTAGAVSLAGLSPRLRPETVAPATPEPALTAIGLRPRTRPATLSVPEPEPEPAPNPVRAAIADPFATATALAVVTSPRPNTRPRNFARTVSRAQANAARAAPRASASASAGSAPQAVGGRAQRPTGPINSATASRATTENAINLRQINLIGVYGSSSNRRALVRLANGRFVKVGVGDRLDGGRVTAIGTDQITYSKGGRSVRLDLPG